MRFAHFFVLAALLFAEPLLSEEPIQPRVRLSLEGSDVALSVTYPQGYTEEEDEEFDLVFTDGQRRLIFHYFQNPEFDTKSMNDVFNFTLWMQETAGLNSPQTNTSIYMDSRYAVRSFSTSDEGGRAIHCYFYVTKVEGDLVIGTLAISPLDLNEAQQEAIRFLEKVYTLRAK